MTATRKRPKRAAYQTPLSIVPAKVSVYDNVLPPEGKNEAPSSDRRQQAAVRRAEREADRIGRRERAAAQRALRTNGTITEIIDRLGRSGVDYSRLLALLEAAGSLAWVARMKLDQIHAIAGRAPIEPWDLWQRVRPIIEVMEQLAEEDQRRLAALTMTNSLHKPVKAKDRDSGEPAGW